MFSETFENNISCGRCRVAYPAHRRTCPCCNEYNPKYLNDPEGDFYNNDVPGAEFDLEFPDVFTFFEEP